MKQFKRLIIPYFIWAIVILVIPLFLIALYAFTTEGNEVMTLSFTWGNFAKFLEATYLNVILKSFWLGLLTTLIMGTITLVNAWNGVAPRSMAAFARFGSRLRTLG